MIDPNRVCYRCMSPLQEHGAFCPQCGADTGTLRNQTNQLPIGSILAGKYLVGCALGQGGFGITYIGWELNLDRKLAIKEYFPEGFVGRDSTTQVSVVPLMGEKAAFFQSGRAKFVDEARILARFANVPGIVSVHDFLNENGSSYIVMDYVDGKTLKQLARERDGKLPASEVLGYLLPVIDSLEKVHAAGLLHRDISPDNIMITPDGRAVLLDFGAARQISAMGEHSNTINVKHGFAPEEQYRTRGDQGPWTDIYALCATIYRLTTGVTPPQSMDRAMSDFPLTPPNVLGADLTEAQQAAILRGLSVRGKDRQQSMAEFKAELTAAAPLVRRETAGADGSHTAVSDGPTTPFARIVQAIKARPRPFIGIGVGLAAILVLVLAVNGSKPAPAASEPPRQQAVFEPDDGAVPTAEPSAAPVSLHSSAAPARTPTPEESIQFEAAVTLYNNKDFAAAVAVLEPLAEGGHPGAQNCLGDCYYFGYGVEQDYALAVTWYEKSAEQGYAEAQYNLGYCYEFGQGVGLDYASAVEWYRTSAEQGFSYAQCNLGHCYEVGQGVKQDLQTAVSWYQKSAGQGNALAQCNLGFCYERGLGTAQDYALAVEWYQKSADQGYARAQCNLGYCYDVGQGVPQSYSRAVEWYRKSAEQGYASAQYNLGFCYAYGQGVDQDYKQAAEWYRKAADQGDAAAQCNLGFCYENGYGVTQNFTTAAEWYQKSADGGDDVGQCNLGYCYEIGQGVAKDYQAAMKWYQKAAEQGLPRAQSNIADLYYYGYGVTQDYETAVSWFRKAADQDYAYAQYSLGYCYAYGQGVAKDVATAKVWLQKAADQGSEDAKALLAKLS